MHYSDYLLVSAAFSGSVASAMTLLPEDTGCLEKGAKLCFGSSSGGASQNLDPGDISYAASYLRNYGSSTTPPAMLTMAPSTKAQCDEWTLYTIGTTLILGKHINPRANSSVLFTDIANTIDGGDTATDSQAAAAILGCGANGGSMEVVVDKTNAAYLTSDYTKYKNTPTGIIIKLVTAPPATT